MTENRNVAELIRNARLEAKLSRQQMASKYDISLRTLESWEDGERTPPDYVLNLLLRCLKADYPEVPTQQIAVPKQKKLLFTYCDEYYKPLPVHIAEKLKVEYESGRISEIESGDDTGELINSKAKLYICTNPSDGIGLGVAFRVIPKEE